VGRPTSEALGAHSRRWHTPLYARSIAIRTLIYSSVLENLAGGRDVFDGSLLCFLPPCQVHVGDICKAC